MNDERSAPTRATTDAEFCAQLRTQLDREALAVDAVTAARLSAARQRALAATDTGRGGARWLPWLGSALAASLLLAVVLGRGAPDALPVAEPVPGGNAVAVAAPAAVIESDVAVIADLEFYDWLEAQDAVL